MPTVAPRVPTEGPVTTLSRDPRGAAVLSGVGTGNRMQARVGWVPKPVDAGLNGCRGESPCVGDDFTVVS